MSAVWASLGGSKDETNVVLDEAMNNIDDSGGGPPGRNEQEEDDGASKWFKVTRKDGYKANYSSQQQRQGSQGQGARQRQKRGQLPPSPPRGPGPKPPRPMTDGEKAHLERTGGCKVCGEIHPIRLCNHPDARVISQRFHEDRLQAKAAKRDRERQTGITPPAKRTPYGKPAATATSGALAAATSTSAEEPAAKMTRKELIKASYSRVASEFKLYLHMEGKPVRVEIFEELRKGLYAFHANSIVEHSKNPSVHVPRWRGGLHRKRIGKDDHFVIGVATEKCRIEVEKWIKLTYPFLDHCHNEKEVPGTFFCFTGHLLGEMVKTLGNEYFTTALANAVEEKHIKGVVTLGGVRHTQGGVTLLVNMDETARADMVAADCRLSLGPDGETGFVEQGGLDKADKIDHEKSLLKAAMDRLQREQEAMSDRYAALAKELTNRQIEEVGGKAANLNVNSGKGNHSARSDSGNHGEQSTKGTSASLINVHVSAGSESLRQGSTPQLAPSANMGGADSVDVVMAGDVTE